MVAGVGWLTPAFVLAASHGRLLWMFWQHETHSPVGKAVRLRQGGFGNRMNGLVDARHPWMLAGTVPGGTSFGAVQGLAAGPGGAVPHSGGIRGRPGLILLSVRAGRLRAHRRVLFLAAGRWGPLAYPAEWSRWVSAVWRRPAPGVRTAWARARRDPARMMSFLARVTPV